MAAGGTAGHVWLPLPLSHTVTTAYDAAGRRTDPDGNRTAWAYDAADRVTTLTDPPTDPIGANVPIEEVVVNRTIRFVRLDDPIDCDHRASSRVEVGEQPGSDGRRHRRAQGIGRE